MRNSSTNARTSHLADGPIARRADAQNLLFRYTDSLYRAENVPQVCEAALDAICEGLGCARASILRFDAGGVMRFMAWRGLSARYRAAVEGHSPWPPGTRDPEPICIENIATSGESDTIKATLAEENICGVAFIPLTANGVLTGKFMVYYDVPRLFTAQESEMALTIARQLGFALERDFGEQAARQLAAIIDSSQDPIVSKTLTGVITTWNRAAERLFGYRADEMVGRSGAALFPPDRADEEPTVLARVAAGETIESYETVRRCKDGRLIDIFLTVSPIKDNDGNVVGVSKIAHDTTEIRRAADQQALLLGEMAHRVKNLFAVASSLVQICARSATSPGELAERVSTRLVALSRAHSLTMAPGTLALAGDQPATRLHALVHAILAPFEGDNPAGQPRIGIEGDDVDMSGSLVTPLALLFYELATNATKYGALSVPAGQVAIRSRRGEGGVALEWREAGGPRVDARGAAGFGSKLIEASALQLGKISRQWDENGLRVEIFLRIH